MDMYGSSLEHLLAELERLDLLIRVQVLRARQTAESATDELAAFYISEKEVDTLLEAPLGLPLWSAAPLSADAQEHIQQQLDQMAATIQARLANSLHQGIYPRLVVLAHLFDLSAFDVDVILLCLAPELDRRYERLYAYLHDDVTRRAPTVELALQLFCPHIEVRLAQRTRFTPTAPLLHHQLLQLFDVSAVRTGSFLSQQLLLDPRVTQYLLDDDQIDAELAVYVQMHANIPTLDDLYFAAPFQAQLKQIARVSETDGADLLLYFYGPPGVGKKSSAAAIAGQLGLPLLVVDGQRLAALTLEPFERLIYRIDREARLQSAALYWTYFDAFLTDEKRLHLTSLLTMLATHPGPTFLAGEAPWRPADALTNLTFLQLAFPEPGFAERRRLWQEALTPMQAALAPAVKLDAVAGKFRLSGGQIVAAAATAINLARVRNPEAPEIGEAELFGACRLHSNRKLAELARQITPRYDWGDLVLPSDLLAQLREVYQQLQYRTQVYEQWGFDARLAMGKGLNVLFAGPPGTGKTMAADVLARALGLDLYKIDLSSLVSKYIGETEKNLARIFNEARSSNAILFFDEADALFGKRTAIKDAHDRHANVEIAYLLQKMEEYDGVVILATNLRKNLDDAFVRRLHFTLDFPIPNFEERRRIWSQIWPDAAPRAPDLDLDYLAQRVELAGGNIRNIALAGAFLAAADGGIVTMQHLFQATRREYQKMGKALSGREFGEYG